MGNISKDQQQLPGEDAAEALEAFEGQDSSVFLVWIRAVTDLMACGDLSNCADETPANVGSLLYALTEAAQELINRERRERMGPAGLAEAA